MQTVRVWSFASGECKLHLRDHEHVVEHVAFAPASSLQAINTMITGDVRLPHCVIYVSYMMYLLWYMCPPM